MAVDKTTILIVEDEPSIVELVNFTLKESGWNTYAVNSASEAWEFMQRRMPHLVLLDLERPIRKGRVGEKRLEWGGCGRRVKKIKGEGMKSEKGGEGLKEGGGNNKRGGGAGEVE